MTMNNPLSPPWPCSAALVHAADVDQALIKQGEYLARAGDCVACHTAKGGKPFAGGLAMKTPIGTIYSTNITPDENRRRRIQLRGLRQGGAPWRRRKRQYLVPGHARIRPTPASAQADMQALVRLLHARRRTGRAGEQGQTTFHGR